MVHAKLLEPDVLKLMLNVSELAKQHIEEYFKISDPLYFSYTHLVCRTSKIGKIHCSTIFTKYYNNTFTGIIFHAGDVKLFLYKIKRQVFCCLLKSNIIYSSLTILNY